MHEESTVLLEKFAAATEKRDVSALQSMLHPAFRVVFTVSGTGETTLLDRDTWLGMLAEGKIGGTHRPVEVQSTRGQGPLRTIEASLLCKNGRFDSIHTWVVHEGRQTLFQDATVFTPSAS
jgi:hypothetical protein